MGPGVKDHMDEVEIGERGFGPTGDRTVCLECICDEGLRAQVAAHLTEHACTFCGREAADGVPIAANFEALMYPVIDAIRFLYERSGESLFWDDDVTRRYSSWDVAQEVCDWAVSDHVLEAILHVITSDDWNKDPGVLAPNVALYHAWSNFCKKIKHETRFVFLSIPEEHSDHPDEFTTREILDKLMEIVQSHKILTDIPTGRVFYRGRMVDDSMTAGYDASKLGSPPLGKAAANRMSPAGISMFYGCDDVDTVVAEISSHRERHFAVIGAFETVRPLRIVNLAALPTIPSVFDLQGRKRYYELLFLWSFARDLSKPVILAAREHIDYVPTQVVTEFIRWLPAAAIDGILYRSAQNGGTSCVIFCGPDGCADEGAETDDTILRLKAGSLQAVPVPPRPVMPPPPPDL